MCVVVTLQQNTKQVKRKLSYFRFPNLANAKKRAREQDEFRDQATGSHRVLKWGAKFNIQESLLIPSHYVDAIATSLSTSTWSTYRTAYNWYIKFMKLSGKSCVFPTSKEDLIGYSVFLFRVRRLAPSTIRQYLAALKTYHAVLDFPLDNFRSTALKYVLKGYENQYKAWDVEGLNRRTFTYAHLQVFAEALARAKLPHYDAQLYFTAATIAYFTSIRMGDILIDGHNSNSSRLLTWERVQAVEEDELILYFAHPKQATRENGQVCELFSFPDKLYCPIENLRKLAILQRSQGKTNEQAHVFVMANGRTLTMRKMNDVLKKHLMPLLDSKLGQISCHSFRCGIPSLMSAHPDVFTTEETVIQGDWHSDAYKLYTRHNGIGRKKTHKKIVRMLTGAC